MATPPSLTYTLSELTAALDRRAVKKEIASGLRSLTTRCPRRGCRGELRLTLRPNLPKGTPSWVSPPTYAVRARCAACAASGHALVVALGLPPPGLGDG